jgi:hypothetical protein
MHKKLASAIIKKLLLLLFLATLFYGCTSDSEVPEPEENQYLVEWSLKSEFERSLIQTFVAISGFPDFVDLVKYDIEIYKLTYKTMVD